MTPRGWRSRTLHLANREIGHDTRRKYLMRGGRIPCALRRLEDRLGVLLAGRSCNLFSQQLVLTGAEA